MTNSRHSTSRRSFVLTVDTDMFEPELDEGCTVIIDPDRAFTVGSLVAVQTFAHRDDSFPLLVQWLGSSQRDDQ
jgi:SOS-response transcriptional repressor LexA